MATSAFPLEKYTVLVRDIEFTLSKGQITFDSPNLFTTSFLGDFSEAATRTLILDSDPEIFEIIVDYLSGYPIVPFDKDELPLRMTVAKATRYLAKDADYLGLTRLRNLLVSPSERFSAYAGISSRRINLLDVLNDKLPDGMTWHNGALVDEGRLPVIVSMRGLGVGLSQGSTLEVNGRRIPTLSTETRLHCSVLDPRAQDKSSLADIYGAAAIDAVIQLNGLKPVLACEFFKTYPSHTLDIRMHLTSRAQAANDAQFYAHMTSLWADELWCTVTGRTAAEMGKRQTLGITLLGVNAWSRLFVVTQENLLSKI